MNDSVRPEDDLGFAGKVAIVTGGGAPDDGARRRCWGSKGLG